MYNILFVSHERKMGGANLALVELVQKLQNAGNQVSVLVLYHGCPIDKELKKMGIDTFASFFGWWQEPENWPGIVKLCFRFLHWLQWISVLRIAGYVKKQHIQIIHSNSGVIDIGAKVAERTGCKHVWHFREYGKEDYRLEYMYPRNQVVAYIKNHSDMVIFISKALQKAYQDVAEVAPHRMVYDGILTEGVPEIREVFSRKPGGKTHFLVTGNISPGKNQLLVLQAAHILVHKFGVSMDDFCIHLAGAETALSESKAYGQALRRFVSDNQMKNVIFHGFVDDMRGLRKQIDVEIVPSVSEAYGRVTLEAMLAGHPVIAANAGANVELVDEGRHGLLFENHDAASLAEQMHLAMEQSFEQVIKDAYQYVLQEHAQENAWKTVMDIYDAIM